MKFEKTKMFKRYMFRLALRIVIFLCVFVLYLVDKQHIWRVMTDPIFSKSVPSVLCGWCS